MRMKVLLFGPYADAVEAPSVELDFPDGAQPTAGEVLSRLAAERPVLRQMLRAARLAVNWEYVRSDFAIRQADELAVVGLVGGG